MGWAIQRPDGTYRCWNANAQDDALLPGEQWVSLPTPPPITMPPNPIKAKVDAVLLSTDVPQVLKAFFALWKTQL